MKLNFLKEAGLYGLSDEPSVRLFIAAGNVARQSRNPAKEADRKDKVFRAGNFYNFWQCSLKIRIFLKMMNYQNCFSLNHFILIMTIYQKPKVFLLNHFVEHSEYNKVIKNSSSFLMKIHQSLCTTNHSLKLVEFLLTTRFKFDRGKVHLLEQPVGKFLSDAKMSRWFSFVPRSTAVINK